MMHAEEFIELYRRAHEEHDRRRNNKTIEYIKANIDKLSNADIMDEAIKRGLI